MRCFGFKLQGDVSGQMLHPLAWCSSLDTFGLQRRLPYGVGCWEGAKPQCPISQIKPNVGSAVGTPRKNDSALHEFTNNPPRHWFYCRFSLGSAGRKISPGVVGLLPGATLLAHVDIAMARPVSLLRPASPPEELGAASAGRVTLNLEYLVSYEQMGTVRLTCAIGCACTRQRIDAHQLGEARACTRCACVLQTTTYNDNDNMHAPCNAPCKAPCNAPGIARCSARCIAPCDVPWSTRYSALCTVGAQRLCLCGAHIRRDATKRDHCTQAWARVGS